MEKHLLTCIIVIASTFFITACGSGSTEPPMETPPLFPPTVNITPQDDDAPIPPIAQAAANTVIRWGHGQGTIFTQTDVSQYAEIIQHMNSLFNVTIIPDRITRRDFDEINNPPNIFHTDTDSNLLLTDSVTRTIPIEMIQRFAPNYFNLLMSNIYINTSYLTYLPIFTGPTDRLHYFSVYRLDLLRYHGIALPDDIVPIRDGLIYFTEIPFTQQQFLEIMDTLLYSPAARDRGLVLAGNYNQLQHLSTLMGMWGLGNSIVNDSGSPNFYFTDSRYKEFLHFMAYLYNQDIFSLVTSARPEAERFRLGMQFTAEWQNWHLQNNVMWLQASLDEILSSRSVWYERQSDRPLGNLYQIHLPQSYFDFFLRSHFEPVILVTPPEVGFFGESGAGRTTMSPFCQTFAWVISGQTTDEQLSAILEIFEYVTFDKNAYVMSNYGVEGKHFFWEDTPFESRILQNAEQLWDAHVSGALVFATGITLPDTDVFRFGDNALLRFANSEAGRNLVILPYRDDVYDEFSARYADLLARYWDTLMSIKEDFFRAAIRGEVNIEHEWDMYINSMRANGLLQFLELIEQFPVVGR